MRGGYSCPIATEPPVAEAAIPSPGPGYIWLPGYHSWNGVSYIWVPGRWEIRPQGRHDWVPGHWNHNRHGWFWIKGHWR
jgi:WXXGXW repeat (2 copies)